MSKQIIVGQSPHRSVKIDLDVLLSTRLLIQANSGGGKSWAIRRLAEQCFGKVQQIIIDPEGEFSTLREKFGFVLVGQGGETPATVRSAGILAHRLLELNASAVCDIYELKSSERHAWVKSFLDSLINAPKKLWQPLLVIVDEAHVYCPEKGQGESEAKDAMTDLATRGRKRRFCPIFATQRLGKLSKNVSAELLNRMVGPTFEDVDVKRAAELLGIPLNEQREFFQERRVAEPGNFYAIGRAIATEIVRFDVGEIETSHGAVGSKAFNAGPPPAPESVAKLLPQLADLPKEAEKKALTENDLRQEIHRLKQEIKQRPTDVQTKVETKVVEVPVVTDVHISAIRGAIEDLRGTAEVLATALTSAQRKPVPIAQPRPVPQKPVAPRTAFKPSTNGNGSEIPRGEKAVLIAIAQFDDGVDRDQLSVLTGYKRSTRDAYVQRLGERGYIAIQGSGITATQEGIDALGLDYEPLPTGDDLREHWFARLPEGERRILEVLVGAYPGSVERGSLEEATGFKRSTRDAYIQRLTSRRLVQTAGAGEVKAADMLFD